MCPVEKITSCQLSFIPIGSENYLSDVNKVLDIIIASGLEHVIGEMATIVKGKKAEILDLINVIYDKMSSNCSFVMDIRLSNACGC